jgi:hypothetical protein
MPTIVAPFGLERVRRDEPDVAAAAEDVVADLIERAHRLGVDGGGLAALVAFDLVASLEAYPRAPVPITLAVLAEAAPIRAALLRSANETGAPRPPLNIARLQEIAPHICRLN